MSQGFFKRNEKLFMVVLLLILAPTFAFTGIMSAVLGDGTSDADSGLHVDGRSVNVRDFKLLRDQLSIFQYANSFKSFPGYGVSVTKEDFRRHVALERQAKESGIVLTDDEFQVRVRDLGIPMIAWYHASNNAAPGTQIFQLYQKVQEDIKGTPFLVKDYKAAVKQYFSNAKLREFEDALRRGFLVEKMLEAVAESVTVSEKDIWEKYDEQNHKRSFELVRVPVGNFAEAGRQAVADALAQGDAGRAELVAFYNDNIKEFELPNRLQISALRLDAIAFNLSYQPQEEEIEDRYERDKKTLYLTTQEFDPFAEQPGDEYLPLETVKAQVVQSLRNDYVEDRGIKILEEVIADAKANPDAKPSLLDRVPEEQRQFFSVIESDLFGAEQIASLPKEISNPARLNELFLNYEAVRVGQVSDQPVPMTDASFIYQVTRKEKAMAPLLADNEEVGRQQWGEQKAKELAMKHLEDWVTRINAPGSTETLESLAAAENYTVHEFTDLTRRESFQMKIDQKPVDGASTIVNSVFQITEQGQVGVPQALPDDSQVFLTSFVSRKDADPAQFEAQRPSLKTQVENQMRQEARDAYAESVASKFDVIWLEPKPEEDDAPAS